MKRFIFHLIPAIVAVLLLLLDFKCSGRLGMVNKPFVAACISTVAGLIAGLLLRTIQRKTMSVVIYSLIHMAVSVFVIFMFFTLVVKDSL